jgi:hypothetical protein
VNEDRQLRGQVIRTVVRTVGIAVVVVAVLVKLIQPGLLILRDWLVPSPFTWFTIIVWWIGVYLLVDYLFYLSKRLGQRRTDQVVRTVVVGVFVVLVVYCLAMPISGPGSGSLRLRRMSDPQRLCGIGWIS